MGVKNGETQISKTVVLCQSLLYTGIIKIINLRKICYRGDCGVSMIAFILILLYIIVIVLVAAAAAKGSMKKEGGENVIKSVYIYLVLFATLMMTIGGSIGAFMALADFIAPTPYYQTFEEYSAIQDKERARDDGQAANLSGEELRKRYEETVVSYRQNQIERAKNSLVKSFGWIVVPFPVFLIVQRRLKKKQEA
jgi:hypothetical protein